MGQLYFQKKQAYSFVWVSCRATSEKQFITYLKSLPRTVRSCASDVNPARQNTL